MVEIDKLILGDNQFFGVNHMSQEKGKQTLDQFKDIGEIKRILYYSMDKGVKGVFFSTHPKIYEICDMMRADDKLKNNYNIYVNVPYIVKYVSMVTEMGIGETIKKVIRENQKGKIAYVLKTAGNVLTLDHMGIIKRLIDAELSPFHGLKVKAVFLHNTLCDLALAYEMGDIFRMFDEYIRREYKAIPGYGTLNYPQFSAFLNEIGLNNSLIMTGVNKLGFLMNPNREECENSIMKKEHTVLGMATLASGRLKPKEAYEYIADLGLEHLIVGLSSKKHADETFGMIQEYVLKER